MPYALNERVSIAYEYDFAVDGGAVGAITLRNVGVNGLKAGLSIVKAHLIIETACASASGTATIGNADVDAYFVDFVGEAAGAYSSMSALGGAALRLSATDVESEVAQRLTADVSPVLTIATGALTAGKFKVVFECIQE